MLRVTRTVLAFAGVLAVLLTHAARAQDPSPCVTFSPVTTWDHPVVLIPGQTLAFSANYAPTPPDCAVVDNIENEWRIYKGPNLVYAGAWNSGSWASMSACFREPGDYGVFADYNIPDEHDSRVGASFTVKVLGDDSCPSWAETCTCQCAGNGSSWGAIVGDPVNLATGVEAYSPGADITAYNPSGIAASYQRTFYTGTGGAVTGHGSPGLPPGWIDNYDYTIVASRDGTGDLSLVSPRGTVESLTPVLGLDNVPTGEFVHADGTPYIVKGTPHTGMPGQWDQIVLTWTDGQKWVFGTGQNYFSWVHRLWRITDVRSSNPLDLSHDNGIEIQRTGDGKISYVNSVKAGVSGQTLLSFTYDSDSGFVTQVEDLPQTRVVDYSYDASGQLFTVSQIGWVGDTLAPPTPQRWTYGYTTVNGEVLLHTMTVPIPKGSGFSQAVIEYGLDAITNDVKVQTVTDGNGFQRAFTYNGGSTLVQVKDDQGRLVKEWTQNFDTGNRNTGTTDEDGNTTVIGYDSSDQYRAATVTDAQFRTVLYTHDAYGHVTSVTDHRNTTTNYTYDYNLNAPMGRLVSTQVGSKHSVDYAYSEPSGLLKKVTTVSPANPAQTVTTHYVYDDLTYDETTDLPKPTLGNLVKVVAPGNNAAASVTTTLDYGTTPRYGEPLSVTDPLNHTTQYTYTGGEVSTVTDALSHTTSYDYNAAGQIEKITDPPSVTNGARAYTKYTYMYTVGTHTYGPTVAVDEFAEGASTALKHQAYSIGPEGEVRSQTGDTEPVTVVYDALYRPKTVTDGNGNPTTYTYDLLGNLTSIKYPRAVDPAVYDTVTYSNFDPDGNPATRTDGNGVVTSFAYQDPDAQLTAVSYGDGTTPAVTITYDAAYGRRWKVQDGSGTTTYSYNDLDNVTSVSTALTGVAGGSKVISYTYYPDGSRNTMVTPAGTSTYAYDLAGRPTGLSNTQAGATAWSYQNNDLLSAQTSLNGVYSTTYSYSGRGFLNQVNNTDSTSGGYSVFNVTSRDGVGNITGLSASFPSLTILPPPSPDSKRGPGGLVSPMSIIPPQPASPFTGTTTYSYAHNSADSTDLLAAYGPLRQETTTRFSGLSFTYAYDNAINPRKLRTADAGGPLPYNADNQRTGYDAYVYDGNGNPTTYKGVALAFDAENRLVQYGVGAYKSIFGYNAAGLRTMKSQGSSTTYFLYDGSLPVVELNASGAVTAVNTFGANGLISRWTSGGATWYQFDPMGNVSSYNKTGGSFTPTGFDAYGWQESYPGSSEVFGYQAQWGGYMDHASGFVLLTHRYYDPTTGRFVTRDPIGQAGGINVYGYVGGDPVNWSDPSGLVAGSLALPLTPTVGGTVSASALTAAAATCATVVVVADSAYEIKNYRHGHPRGLFTWIGEKIADAVLPTHFDPPPQRFPCLVATAAGQPRNWATEQAKIIAAERGMTPCEVLKEMYAAASDSGTREVINQAMKFLGCKGSRYWKGGNKR